jgi:hypothetical protein
LQQLKLHELRGAILQAAAKRELAVREIEGDSFLPRPVYPAGDLQGGRRRAAGSEVIMDANQVKTFCAVAAQLMPAFDEDASIEASQRKPEADALIRQLRVAAVATAHALMEIPRAPPPMSMMPAPLNVGSPS